MVDVKVDELFVNDVFETTDWLATAYPEVHEARSRLASVVMAPDTALALRLKEIVAVVVLAYRHDPTVETHMRRALAAGSTIREITEAIMAACTPGGQPSLHHATPHLKTLIDELGEEADRRGPGEAEPARTFRETTQGAWPWLQEHYPEYQHIRLELNRVMLMPDDASLQVRYREIMTAVVLACRSYPTVPHHLRRAVVEGATLAEIVEAMQVGALFGGAPVFHHALPFLMQIHDDIEAGTLAPAPVES